MAHHRKPQPPPPPNLGILSDEELHTIRNADGEEHTVYIIKHRLRTPEQKTWLDAQDLSIEDLLNGRYNAEQEPIIFKMYADWNAKIGEFTFGHRRQP